MAMEIHCDIVSAEEQIFSGPVTFLAARADHGELGVKPRHAPLLAQLQPGEIRVFNQSGEEKDFYISGGMIEIQPHVVTILADTAIRAKDLDEAKALEAKKSAEEALKNSQSDFDYARAQTELIEAAAQLRTIKNIRSRAKR